MNGFAAVAYQQDKEQPAGTGALIRLAEGSAGIREEYAENVWPRSQAQRLK